MTKYLWRVLAFLMLGGLVFGQTPQPQLSTADKVAIQSLEKVKQDAQQTFNSAQQSEITVLREWETAHPGWNINPQTFAITAEPKKEALKK